MTIGELIKELTRAATKYPRGFDTPVLVVPDKAYHRTDENAKAAVIRDACPVYIEDSAMPHMPCLALTTSATFDARFELPKSKTDYYALLQFYHAITAAAEYIEPMYSPTDDDSALSFKADRLWSDMRKQICTLISEAAANNAE